MASAFITQFKHPCPRIGSIGPQRENHRPSPVPQSTSPTAPPSAVTGNLCFAIDYQRSGCIARQLPAHLPAFPIMAEPVQHNRHAKFDNRTQSRSTTDAKRYHWAALRPSSGTITTGVVGSIVFLESTSEVIHTKSLLRTPFARFSIFIVWFPIVYLTSFQPPAACFTIHSTPPVSLPSAGGINEHMHFCAGTAGVAKDGLDVELLSEVHKFAGS